MKVLKLQKKNFELEINLKYKKEDILIALSKSDGNKKEAATLLGIGRATLYRYLELYDLK